MFFNSVRVVYSVGSVLTGLTTTTIAINPITIGIIATAAVAGTAVCVLNPAKK